MNSVNNKTRYVLALQHVLAMFGGTILIPMLIGLDPSIALLSAGVGTLAFHLVTGGEVPVFLGSSGAFVSVIAVTLELEGMAYVKGAVIVAGFIYVFISGLIRLFGVDKVKRLFPPIVSGPIIIVIGLRLSPIATGMAGISADGTDFYSLAIAVIVIATMAVMTFVNHSFFKLVPVLIAIIVGFIACFIFDKFLGTQFLDLTPVYNASWLGYSDTALGSLYTTPKFSITAILAIAPVALVVFMEHIGDITTNGAVVGKNFFEKPGIDRTMLGDGVATILAGFIGGPPNTTYGENTGVLAVTKVYDPKILRIAAFMAIVLSFLGKFNALIQVIPPCVMGGLSIILFGMISSVGVRTLAEAELDFSHSRNLFVTSIIFVLGIGVNELVVTETISISGLALAAMAGVLMNLIMPQIEQEDEDIEQKEVVEDTRKEQKEVAKDTQKGEQKEQKEVAEDTKKGEQKEVAKDIKKD